MVSAFAGSGSNPFRTLNRNKGNTEAQYALREFQEGLRNRWHEADEAVVLLKRSKQLEQNDKRITIELTVSDLKHWPETEG